MDDELERRARAHAALGEPTRLAIVEALSVSDRSPSGLAELFDISSNLLAHHLDTLVAADLVERVASAGDRRRKYVRLRRDSLAPLAVGHGIPTAGFAAEPTVFVCSKNSARSQLAAAMWASRTGGPSASAGTHPADRVHPGAVSAAARIGLDIGGATPRELGPIGPGTRVVTVCDQAHEELPATVPTWHWSIPDPVADGTDEAFDAVVHELDIRIDSITSSTHSGTPPT